VRRRDFIKFLLGSAAAWPLALRAQQAAKVYRIGYLGVTSYAEYTREIEALLKGLRQLGYEEGKNIAIHYQFAGGDYDRPPDPWYAWARAARQATSTIPIVVMAAADLVSSGLVPSIARPGGNLTGLTFFFAEICAKRVELIKEAVPGATRLGVLVNPVNPSGEMALTAMQRTEFELHFPVLIRLPGSLILERMGVLFLPVVGFLRGCAWQRGTDGSLWTLVARQRRRGEIAMPYRQQFRNYAEHCLRLAELIDAPEQRASLIDTANAWHRFAQELDLRDKPTDRGSPHHRNTQGTSRPNSPYGIRS
jgi:ABC transporter substrate binding protein